MEIIPRVLLNKREGSYFIPDSTLVTLDFGKIKTFEHLMDAVAAQNPGLEFTAEHLIEPVPGYQISWKPVTEFTQVLTEKELFEQE